MRNRALFDRGGALRWRGVAGAFLVLAFVAAENSVLLSLLPPPAPPPARCPAPPGEPIDAVYTWVNGSDPAFLRKLRAYRDGRPPSHAGPVGGDDNGTVDDQASLARYRDNDELRYSMRSIERHAPWIRHIYLVTNGQVPTWLDLANPRVSVVTHEEIFPHRSHLPTFSSPAIEAHLHRIRGLSERFLYFNDDVMLADDVWPDDFYTVANGQKVYLTWDVPGCSDGCSSQWLGDGYCDLSCNVTACQFDRGDCANATAAGDDDGFLFPGGHGGDTDSKSCVEGCPLSWVGDRLCDERCKVEECGFDAGDCGLEAMQEGMLGFDVANQVASPRPPAAVSPTAAAAGDAAPDTPNNTPYRSQTTRVEVPGDAAAVFFKLDGIFPEGEVASASHNSPRVVKTASVSQQLAVLTLVLQPFRQAHNITVTMTGRGGAPAEEGFVATLIVGVEARQWDEDAGDYDEDYATGLGEWGLGGGGSWGEGEGEGEGEDGEDEGGNGVELEEGSEGEISEAGEGKEQHAEISIDGARGEEEEGEGEGDGTWVLDRRRLAAAEGSSPLDTGYRPRLERVVDSTGARQSMRRAAGRRRLLDTFAESLRYVDGLLDSAYGTGRTRRVPAHMPHMIDRRVMEDVEKRWGEKIEETSSHRFRAPDDMQYAFTHFYTMMLEPRGRLPQDLLVEVDTDQDGALCDNEFRSLLARVGMESSRSDVERQRREIRGGKAGPERLALSEVLGDEALVGRIRRMLDREHKYRHEMGNSDHVNFQMLGDNLTTVVEQLQSVRNRPPKFLCLNDNMNSSSPNPDVVEEIRLLLESLFPLPSSFELSTPRRGGWLPPSSMRPLQKLKWAVIVVVAAGYAVFATVILHGQRSCSRWPPWLKGRRRSRVGRAMEV